MAASNTVFVVSCSSSPWGALIISHRLRPRGRQRSGSVGPKIERVLVPTAAAKCPGPESFPMKSSALATRRARSEGVCGASTVRLSARSSIPSLSRSTDPARNRMCQSARASMSARRRNRSRGQHLSRLPLPGWMATNRRGIRLSVLGEELDGTVTVGIEISGFSPAALRGSRR